MTKLGGLLTGLLEPPDRQDIEVCLNGYSKMLSDALSPVKAVAGIFCWDDPRGEPSLVMSCRDGQNREFLFSALEAPKANREGSPSAGCIKKLFLSSTYKGKKL